MLCMVLYLSVSDLLHTKLQILDRYDNVADFH